MTKYETVDDYISDQTKEFADIITELRAIVKEAAPKAVEKMMWAQPVYKSSEGPFCFIKAHKNHINVGFWRGAEMKDPKELFLGTGVKMRHIKIKRMRDVRKSDITDFVKQGLFLNKEMGDPT